ncbi:MAG: tRNA nucleotidyltransferase [Clostridia bacterium]|nr:tRNA nucleotidyltransferase [Clostridia bacterium]
MPDPVGDMQLARALAEKVAACGGTAYFVGGFVRDRLRGEESKDIDIEVHGVTPKTLEEILDTLGERLSIGESFGVYNLKHCGVDIAMPRKEKLIGRGHKDFDVFVDPFIGTEKAAVRRDFTINALMQNVLTGEVVDHFGGLDDLKNGILRHVNDETFAEDPLRVLRAAQFAARFGYALAPETVAICRSIPLDALSKERVAGELYKALLKADRPSVFFSVLRECGALGFWFPEVGALIGVPQNPRFHAEGDVWNHTLLVLDEAAKLRERTNFPKGFMLSALTHDLGKPLCTELVDGRIRSYKHEIKGLAPARKLLERLTNEKKLISYVLNMTLLHMRPNMLADADSAIKRTNALFDEAVDPEDLILLCAADSRGSLSEEPKPDYTDFLFDRLRIYRETTAKPGVTGQDLRDAGLKPDKNFSELLKYAHKLQLSGLDKEAALKQTLARAKETS